MACTFPTYSFMNKENIVCKIIFPITQSQQTCQHLQAKKHNLTHLSHPQKLSFPSSNQSNKKERKESLQVIENSLFGMELNIRVKEQHFVCVCVCVCFCVGAVLKMIGIPSFTLALMMTISYFFSLLLVFFYSALLEKAFK